MRIHIAAISILTVCLFACRPAKENAEASQVFIFSCFRMNDEDRKPTATELAALEVFTDGLYNPSGETVAVDDTNLEQMGFSPVVTGTRPIQRNETGVMAFQNIPWDKEGTKRLQIYRKVTSDGVEIFSETDILKPRIADEKESLVGSVDSGSHFFGEGLVVAWATKPLRE